MDFSLHGLVIYRRSLSGTVSLTTGSSPQGLARPTDISVRNLAALAIRQSVKQKAL